MMEKITKFLIVLGVLFQFSAFGAEITTKFPNNSEQISLLPIATINKGERMSIITVMKSAIQGKELTNELPNGVYLVDIYYDNNIFSTKIVKLF